MIPRRLEIGKIYSFSGNAPGLYLALYQPNCWGVSDRVGHRIFELKRGMLTTILGTEPYRQTYIRYLTITEGTTGLIYQATGINYSTIFKEIKCNA